MTPETWADVFNWILLATGAALAAGTGAALLRYRRTGVFPGQQTDDEGRPTTAPSVRTAVVKTVIGVVLAVWGLAGLIVGTAPLG